MVSMALGRTPSKLFLVLRSGVLRHADSLELAAGALGVLCNLIWFTTSEGHQSWPVYLFFSLALGFVVMMIRDAMRRCLSDGSFDDDGRFFGEHQGLYLTVIGMQCLGSFILTGVYGILLAAFLT